MHRGDETGQATLLGCFVCFLRILQGRVFELPTGICYLLGLPAACRCPWVLTSACILFWFHLERPKIQQSFQAPAWCMSPLSLIPYYSLLSSSPHMQSGRWELSSCSCTSPEPAVLRSCRCWTSETSGRRWVELPLSILVRARSRHSRFFLIN